jgi:hypothetical protein
MASDGNNFIAIRTLKRFAVKSALRIQRWRWRYANSRLAV